MAAVVESGQGVPLRQHCLFSDFQPATERPDCQNQQDDQEPANHARRT